MPRRPKPKPVPEPPLPYGVEGPAGREESEEHKRESRTYVKLPPTNVHGRLVSGTWPQFELRSQSETAFPTMFNPADSQFWHGLSDEQQLEVTRIQAAAMERVGFESGTKKYFIDADEDLTDLYTVLGQEKPTAEERNNELAGGGKWIGGGVLIGAGVAALALALSPLVNPQAGLDGLFTWGGAAGIILGGVLAAIRVEPRKK
jgi:hypothetical protein